MPEPQLSPSRSAAFMVGARLASMVVGLLTIPVLIQSLGGTGFAAWAILLALAGGFSLLELGLGPAVIRFLAMQPNEGTGERHEIFARAWTLMALSFAAGFAVVLLVVRPAVSWLGLPGTALFAPQGLICAVFLAVSARAFLQNGVWALAAARKFRAVAAVALLQSLVSNVSAMVAAWQTGRLDMALIAFWGGQLAVVAVTFALTWRMGHPRFHRATFDRRRLGELGYYGLSSQMEGAAQFINFQFDKFIIAGFVGLWAVAPYEVGNRAVAALRSIPASGAETFLPNAMASNSDESARWNWYVASMRLAAYGVALFILAPLAVAPLFLYAWTGEMGYLGRWAFVALAIGAAANVLSTPAAALAQATGQPGLQGRAAAVAVLVNVPLSLFLVVGWGLAGAAIGTGLAMIAGSMQLTYSVHRHFGRPLMPTLSALGKFWPLLVVSLCWGAVIYVAFSQWIETLPAAERFSHVTRWVPGLVAVALYAVCVASMLVVQRYRGAWTREERKLLAKVGFTTGWRHRHRH